MENLETSSGVVVHYDQVVLPETFTFGENFAWAVRSFLAPEETLSNAVFMYGYRFDTACGVNFGQDTDTPAALAVRSGSGSDGEGEVLPVIEPYNSVTNACIADSANEMDNEGDRLNGAVPSGPSSNFSVDEATIRRFAQEIAEIEAEADSGWQLPLLFSVGRLVDAGPGLELWAFCSETTACFGHPNWSAEAPPNALPIEPGD